MGIKKWTLLCLGLLLIATPAFGADKIKLPCEVLEASPAFKSPSGLLSGVGYLLIHQANSADRERFSKWLRAHSGTEVRFIVNQKKYKGIFCRLAHCFGRGLLIYQGDVTAKKRDIIDVILPLSP